VVWGFFVFPRDIFFPQKKNLGQFGPPPPPPPFYMRLISNA